jgi:hypothetical protein
MARRMDAVSFEAHLSRRRCRRLTVEGAGRDARHAGLE